jgi:uncharacterized cupredoxin-like copper-binding protein
LRAARLAVVLAATFLAPILVVVGVSAATTTSVPYSMTVEISIHYSQYDPSSLAVPVGVPVRFVIHNNDPIDHEWIVGDAAVHAIHRSGTEMHHGARPTEVSLAAFQTIETVVTFTSTRRLTYVCHLPGHEAYGMVGTLDIR